MSTRELVVLGTSSQVPTRHRNHNGYLLLWDGQGILFDPGEGTQRQMVYAGLSASQITRICVTHFHGDHCLGLAGIVQRISLDRVPHRVPVYFPASGRVFWERLRHASAFDDHARTDERPLSVPGPQDELEPSTIARPLRHSIESWGYRLQAADAWRAVPERLAAAGLRGPDVGRILREGELTRDGRTVRREDVAELRPGGSVAFVMDTAPCAAAVELARDVDLLICESTYLESERREAHERGHMTALDAATIARTAGSRRLVLTHFSQRYPSTVPFLEEASTRFEAVIAAEDGMRIPIRA